MPQSRIVLVATMLVLSCASCSQADVPPSTAPSPSSSASSPTAPTSSATPSVPSYLTKYSPDERTAYDAALADRRRFSNRQAAIYEQGDATPSAKAFYRKYTSSWQSYWGRLRQFEEQGIRVVGRSEVISIRPVEIRLGRQGTGSIMLDLCGEGGAVKVIQNGTPVAQPSRKPSIVKVAMVKLEGERRWRVLYERAAEQQC